MVRIHGQATFMRMVYKMAGRLADGAVKSGVIPAAMRDKKFVEVLGGFLKSVGQELPKKYR